MNHFKRHINGLGVQASNVLVICFNLFHSLMIRATADHEPKTWINGLMILK